jgi:hypothetical protein
MQLLGYHDEALCSFTCRQDRDAAVIDLLQQDLGLHGPSTHLIPNPSISYHL